MGGFGQEESEIVLQNPIRIFGYLAFLLLLLTQISLVLKKNNLKSSSCRIKFLIVIKIKE
jgi:apocytochrome f